MYETVTSDADLATKKDLKELDVKLTQHQLVTHKEIKELEFKFETSIKELDVKLTQHQLITHKEIKDLDLKLEQYRYESIKFIVWTGIGVIISLGGLLSKGFHWF